jgi:hypothetical protein
VRAITPPLVLLDLDGGGAVSVCVRPDDPVEIELPETLGAANLVEGLGLVEITGHRTGHRTTYVLPTKWAAGRKIVEL